MNSSCIEPHLVGYQWIIRRHEVRQYKRFDARGLSDTTGLFG